MDELGVRLKRAREASGVTLKEIAGRTKISVSALDALERNDFNKLPGGIFGRAFVRAYAVEIGLDPEATVSDFQVHLEQLEREAAERGAARPEVTADDRQFLARQQRAVRGLRVVVALLVVASVGLLFVRVRPFFVRPAAAPETASAAAPASSLPPPPIPSPTAPEMPVATTPAEPVPAQADGPFVVEFTITRGDCVVSWSADGQPATEQSFHAGSRQRIEATRQLSISVSNAGVFQWTINSKRAKRLGRAGAAAEVELTAGALGAFIQKTGC